MSDENPYSPLDDLKQLAKDISYAGHIRSWEARIDASYGPALSKREKQIGQTELDRQITEGDFEKLAVAYNRARELKYDLNHSLLPNLEDRCAEDQYFHILDYIDDIPAQAHLQVFVDYANSLQLEETPSEVPVDERIRLAELAAHAFIRIFHEGEVAEIDDEEEKTVSEDVEQRLGDLLRPFIAGSEGR